MRYKERSIQYRKLAISDLVCALISLFFLAICAIHWSEDLRGIAALGFFASAFSISGLLNCGKWRGTR